ncbi:MAG: glycosyltransferase [Candidatus Dependentiae bacterium]|nr:glycosyltransferase [Candidatus Dependentiae bacterium]
MKQKNDLHVLYIITKLELGGAQKVCLSLLEGLESSEMTASLISSAQGTLVNAVKNKPNVVLLKSLQRELSFFTLFNELKCFFELIGHIRTFKKKYPNLIVHTHSTKAGIWGRWAAFFAGVTNRVHTIHGYAFHAHQSKLAWVTIYMCELLTSFVTTHFVCVSSEDVKTGIKLFPRFAKKHSIIRAAVDFKQFYMPATKLTTFPNHKQKFIFGTVACFKKQKNLFDLLQAFAFVHKKDSRTHLEIIGDGSLRPYIEQWIIKHHLTDAITLHGWQEHVAPIMMDWHAFVLSSLWEGLPCAIIEARLLKLPVLSYNTGGIHDVIISGENGFLYKQGDLQHLAHGMLSLTQNQPLHSKMQQYPDDLRDFDTPQMVHEHLELYQQLVK